MSKEHSNRSLHIGIMQHNPYLSMFIWEESLENKLFKYQWMHQKSSNHETRCVAKWPFLFLLFRMNNDRCTWYCYTVRHWTLVILYFYSSLILSKRDKFKIITLLKQLRLCNMLTEHFEYKLPSVFLKYCAIKIHTLYTSQQYHFKESTI